MARPKKEEPLEKLINIRVSKKTHERLQDVAKASGLRMYDVVRRRLEGVQIPDRTEIELLEKVICLRQALIKQGGLIKYLYNQNPFEPELTRSLLQKQENAVDSANRLLNMMEEKLK